MRSVIEAWGTDNLAQLLGYCGEDIEWHPVFESRLSGQAAAYRGHEGMRRAWNEYRQISGHIHGRGKGSEMPSTHPWPCSSACATAISSGRRISRTTSRACARPDSPKSDTDYLLVVKTGLDAVLVVEV